MLDQAGIGNAITSAVASLSLSPLLFGWLVAALLRVAANRLEELFKRRAEDAGAKLFLVPPDNCPDVTDLDPDLRLVKATTMHDARLAIETWVKDKSADLPAC